MAKRKAAKAAPSKPCPDCVAEGVTTERPIKGKGRCATHLRVHNKGLATKAHDARISRVYGVARGFYAKLLAFQGGKCAICRVATGRARRLAIDHRHSDGMVRGALCGNCNRIIGMWFDNPETFRRAAHYLENPPAAALLMADDGPEAA